MKLQLCVYSHGNMLANLLRALFSALVATVEGLLALGSRDCSQQRVSVSKKRATHTHPVLVFEPHVTLLMIL